MCRKGVDVMYRVKRFWNTNIDEYEYFIQNIKNKEIIAVTSNKDDADKIVKALEKQIEKTPIQSYYSEGDYTWECVNCEETVDEGQNYCHHCGQKLLEWD
jgi:superfamily II helicase